MKPCKSPSEDLCVSKPAMYNQTVWDCTEESKEKQCASWCDTTDDLYTYLEEGQRLIPSLTPSEDELLCRVKHVFCLNKWGKSGKYSPLWPGDGSFQRQQQGPPETPCVLPQLPRTTSPPCSLWSVCSRCCCLTEVPLRSFFLFPLERAKRAEQRSRKGQGRKGS